MIDFRTANPATNTYSRRDGEVTSLQLIGEPSDSLTSVAEDDSLRNVQSVVQIAQGVQLPLFLLDVDEELANTFQGQFFLLHQDAHGVVHESAGDFQGISIHGGGEQANLDVVGQSLEDVVDLVLETLGQHLVSLIQHEGLDGVRLEGATVDHVQNSEIFNVNK